MSSTFALPVPAVQSESICNTHTHTNAPTTVTLPRIHVLGLITLIIAVTGTVIATDIPAAAEEDNPIIEKPKLIKL